MSNLCQSTPARPQSGRAANEPNRPKVPRKMLWLWSWLCDFFSHIVRILLIWRHRVRNSQTTPYPDPDHDAAPSAIIQQLFHCLEKGFLFLFPLALLHFCATFALLIKFDIQVPCVCVWRGTGRSRRENHFPPKGIWDSSCSSSLTRLSAEICIQAEKNPPQKRRQLASALINNFINEKH